MNKLKLVFSILLCFISLIALSSCIDQDSYNKKNSSGIIKEGQVMDDPKQDFEFTENSFDFGIIKQSGGLVSHDFNFIYNGDNELEITGVPTRCACTSASGNKTVLKKGDKGGVSVVFNPNLKDEPKGKFFKTVSWLTEPSVIEL